MQRELSDPHTVGLTNHIGGHYIAIDSDKIRLFGDQDKYVMIVEHECAHALGLDHVQIKHTLMYPAYNNGVKCVDEVTAMQLASVLSLNKENLNWCTNP